ncbi:MAG: hypothetical protein QXE50_08340 [Nitrososphaerota archaeon]
MIEQETELQPVSVTIHIGGAMGNITFHVLPRLYILPLKRMLEKLEDVWEMGKGGLQKGEERPTREKIAGQLIFASIAATLGYGMTEIGQTLGITRVRAHSLITRPRVRPLPVIPLLLILRAHGLITIPAID